jgi:hypothetical protein
MSGKASPLAGPIAGDRAVVYLLVGGQSAGLTAKESADA